MQWWSVSVIKWAMPVVVCVGVLGCAVHARDEGVNVGGTSAFAQLVPAQEVENSAAQEYAKMLSYAASKNALAPRDNQQLQRLRAIARKIIPFAAQWNPNARNWRWEVNLIGSDQVNAFCMPGGKIAFYTGILHKLALTDDEVAMVMGHEMAHALREHARERMAKNNVTSIGVSVVSQLFGLGALGQTATNFGAKLLTLEFSRADESEADLVGMELAARAGFNPQAAVTLWQKMSANNRSAPPQWLSTHPSGDSRIEEIQANLPQVLPLYEKARQVKP